MILIVAMSGNTKAALIFFLEWVLFIVFCWAVYRGEVRGWFTTEEPFPMSGNVVKVLSLPEFHGKQAVSGLLMALAIGTVQYPRISQNFGGGRPVKVIVFLKPGLGTDPLLQGSLNGKTVDLVFRRGTKLGLRSSIFGRDQTVVVDEGQIDHLFVGDKIAEPETQGIKSKTPQ